MSVDSILGLMRMTEDGDKAIGEIAKLILTLLDRNQEAEARADFAEAALDAEKAKVAELEATLQKERAERSASASLEPPPRDAAVIDLRPKMVLTPPPLIRRPPARVSR